MQAWTEIKSGNFKRLPRLVEADKHEKCLSIDSVKTCNCPNNHINCLDAKEWLQAMIPVWEFTYESRDVRDKDVHPATFPLALARKVISIFTHKGELVIDPFNGSGTTLLAAFDLDRNAIGFELQKKYCDLSVSRILNEGKFRNSNQVVIHGDCRDSWKLLQAGNASLIFTSPPYANALNRALKNKSYKERETKETTGKNFQYSQDERDLGILGGEKWGEAMQDIFSPLLSALKPGGHCVVNVVDIFWEGKKVPLGNITINSLTSIGYEFKNMIIWDKRRLFNGTGIFGWPNNYLIVGAYEYIIDFVKPDYRRKKK